MAETIVPWACEWLLHFEEWLFSGEWDGGSLHLTPVKSPSVPIESGVIL
jgi:hypothetical protein